MAKAKIKPLLPSLREKKRYLVFEVISEKNHGLADVQTALDKAMHSFLGELGMSRAGIIFLKDKWNQDLQRGMLRLNNKHADEVRASLMTLKKINSADVIIRSLGLSGMIKKAEQKYLN